MFWHRSYTGRLRLTQPAFLWAPHSVARHLPRHLGILPTVARCDIKSADLHFLGIEESHDVGVSLVITFQLSKHGFEMSRRGSGAQGSAEVEIRLPKLQAQKTQGGWLSALHRLVLTQLNKFAWPATVVRRK